MKANNSNPPRLLNLIQQCPASTKPLVATALSYLDQVRQAARDRTYRLSPYAHLDLSKLLAVLQIVARVPNLTVIVPISGLTGEVDDSFLKDHPEWLTPELYDSDSYDLDERNLFLSEQVSRFGRRLPTGQQAELLRGVLKFMGNDLMISLVNNHFRFFANLPPKENDPTNPKSLFSIVARAPTRITYCVLAAALLGDRPSLMSFLPLVKHMVDFIPIGSLKQGHYWACLTG